MVSSLLMSPETNSLLFNLSSSICIFGHKAPVIIKIITAKIHQVVQPDRRVQGNIMTAQHNKTAIKNALFRDILNKLACQVKNATNGTLPKITVISYVRTRVPLHIEQSF